MTESARVRTDRALQCGGYADMRPVYRSMLKRLKQKDGALFDEATARYQDTLQPALADDSADPIVAWVEYGEWLARKLTTGRLVHLDATGLAADGLAVPASDRVLLYLPDETDEAAIPLLRPSEPSAAQLAALELLVR